MKSMKLLSFISVIALMLFACSKDDNNENISENVDTDKVEDLVVLDNLSDDIKDMITNNEDLSYKDIQDKIQGNNDIESTEVEDGVLCVYMKNGLQLQVDLEGNSLLADNEKTCSPALILTLVFSYFAGAILLAKNLFQIRV